MRKKKKKKGKKKRVRELGARVYTSSEEEYRTPSKRRKKDASFISRKVTHTEPSFEKFNLSVFISSGYGNRFKKVSLYNISEMDDNFEKLTFFVDKLNENGILKIRLQNKWTMSSSLGEYLIVNLKINNQYLRTEDNEPNFYLERKGGRKSTINIDSFCKTNVESRTTEKFPLKLKMLGIQIEEEEMNETPYNHFFIEIYDSITTKTIERQREEDHILNIDENIFKEEINDLQEDKLISELFKLNKVGLKIGDPRKTARKFKKNLTILKLKKTNLIKRIKIVPSKKRFCRYNLSKRLTIPLHRADEWNSKDFYCFLLDNVYFFKENSTHSKKIPCRKIPESLLLKKVDGDFFINEMNSNYLSHLKYKDFTGISEENQIILMRFAQKERVRALEERKKEEVRMEIINMNKEDEEQEEFVDLF